MTDYSRWAKFDPDAMCIEIEKRETVEDSRRTKKKTFVDSARQEELTILQARRDADSLQSRTEVEALKASGDTRRRRRNKPVADTPGSAPSASGLPSDSLQALQALEDPKATLPQLLNSVTDFLLSLLKDVEHVRACTEKKESHLEGFHAALRCMREIGTFSRIKSVTLAAAQEGVGEEGKSSSSKEIIEGLTRSEAFLVDQTCNCLCLFALSLGETALASDLARLVLKRQGEEADAGVWAMRGMTFAAMGAPYLAALHCRTALGVKADYPGLRESVPLLEAAQLRHAKRAWNCTVEELLSLEVARALRLHRHSRARCLAQVPDLALLHGEDVHAMLEEGDLWAEEAGVGVDEAGAGGAEGRAGEAGMGVEGAGIATKALHMEDADAGVGAGEGQKRECTALSRLTCSPATIAAALLAGAGGVGGAGAGVGGGAGAGKGSDGQSPRDRLNARLYGKIRCLDPNTTTTTPTTSTTSPTTATASAHAIVSCLYLVRKLYYEAQVLYLEQFFKTAEVKYGAAVLLVEAAEVLYRDLEGTWVVGGGGVGGVGVGA
ncbi:hypothetical protein B484DRAFT_479332, partial [Ochromonadaceae sp. CCMP2298]